MIDPKMLEYRQKLPLSIKERMSIDRIETYARKHGGEVYCAFSGGKDSTVLRHLCEQSGYKIRSVFCNTGMEYPEIVRFVRSFSDVTIIRPKMNHVQVIKKYGYPVISKEQAKYIREVQNGTTEYMKEKRLYGKNGTRTGMISKKWQYLIHAPFKISEQCCDVMKKRPFHKFNKESGLVPIIGTMAENSTLRKQSYIKYGCEIDKVGKEQLRPMMFWRTEDVWEYIRKYKLKYCDLYDEGIDRTGCMFCMFGVHLDVEPNRFHLLKVSHPKIYNYCINKLGLGKILTYIKVNY